MSDHDLPGTTGRPNGPVGDLATPVTAKADFADFDPARWKDFASGPLDPSRPVPTAVGNKIEVVKPPSDYFTFVRPDPEYNAVLPLYSDSAGRRGQPFLISPGLVSALPPQVSANILPTRLAVAVTDVGRIFLWPVAQTGSDWHAAAEAAMLRAMSGWLKIKASQSGYDVLEPAATIPPPVWPEVSFQEYLFLAFRDRYIKGLDHPVVKRLAGIR